MCVREKEYVCKRESVCVRKRESVCVRKREIERAKMFFDKRLIFKYFREMLKRQESL